MIAHAVDNNAPIGVFDSGIGGLTILKLLREALPHESFLYFGDLARSPYGLKSPETVRRYALQIADFFLARKVKLIVIACNTASAVAGRAVQEHAGSIPVIEVITHGAMAAFEALPEECRKSAGRPARFGIIGTETTINSGVYRECLKRMARELNMSDPFFSEKACPLFVPLVEEGIWNGPIADLTAGHYLGAMRSFQPDVVILGCTHYPVLSGSIAGALAEDTRLADCAPCVVRSVRNILSAHDAACDADRGGAITFFCSDSADTFRRQAERFLDMPIEIVHHGNLDSREGLFR